MIGFLLVMLSSTLYLLFSDEPWRDTAGPEWGEGERLWSRCLGRSCSAHVATRGCQGDIQPGPHSLQPSPGVASTSPWPPDVARAPPGALPPCWQQTSQPQPHVHAHLPALAHLYPPRNRSCSSSSGLHNTVSFFTATPSPGTSESQPWELGPSMFAFTALSRR